MINFRPSSGTPQSAQRSAAQRPDDPTDRGADRCAKSTKKPSTTVVCMTYARADANSYAYSYAESDKSIPRPVSLLLHGHALEILPRKHLHPCCRPQSQRLIRGAFHSPTRGAGGGGQSPPCSGGQGLDGIPIGYGRLRVNRGC